MEIKLRKREIAKKKKRSVATDFPLSNDAEISEQRFNLDFKK